MDEIRESWIRARTGDLDATIRLIELLAPIRKSLISKYSAPSDREDDEQDLVILLMELIHTYDGESSSFQWYARERSRYHMLDKLKEEKLISLDEETPEGEALLYNLTSEEDLVDRILDVKNTEELLADFVNQLSALHQDIVRLKFYRNYRGKEISKKLNISESKVSRELKRALRILRRKINDYRQKTNSI